MKAIIYPYDEAPIVLEDVTGLAKEGDDLTIVNYEGQLHVELDEVVRVEFTHE